MSDSRETSALRKAAVIGLGQMGRGIARNLDRAGRLAAAWDLDAKARQADLSAAVVLAEPSVFAALSTVIFVVPGSAEIRAILCANGGLLGQPHQRQVLIDLTTSHPAATRELAALARATGRDYVDCGMTGGAKAADAGTLTLMVGGARAVVDACRPTLAAFASNIVHVGDTGSGHTMKLIHNMICHTIFLATSEGCRLAERLGISLETAIAVIKFGQRAQFRQRAAISRPHCFTHLRRPFENGQPRQGPGDGRGPGTASRRARSLQLAGCRYSGAGDATGPGRARFHGPLSASRADHAKRWAAGLTAPELRPLMWSAKPKQQHGLRGGIHAA